MHRELLGSHNRHALILHGWGHTISESKPLGELLSSCYTVHLLDLPGFGASPPPDRVWSAKEYADHIVSYMQEHRIEKALLIGHSFGGKVAISLAATSPHLVERLVLLASSGLIRQRTIKERGKKQALRALVFVVKKWDRFFGTALFENKIAPRFGSSDYARATGVMRAILVKSVNEDLSETIRKIKVPTLILWGEEDQETPPEMARRLQKLIVHSRLHLFPFKGHHLHEDTGASLCAAYILKEALAS